MKTKYSRITLSMCFLVILLAACQLSSTGNGPASEAALVNYTVELSAAKGATEIEVVTPDQGCGTDQKGHKGCVQCNKDEVCTIEFKLKLGEGQFGGACTADPPPDWVITKVELSAHGDKQTGKGEFGKKPTGWMINAFPGINEDDGTVYTQADTSKATQSATIIDLNNHRGGAVNTAYYQVTATGCGDPPGSIHTDPAIQNKGK